MSNGEHVLVPLGAALASFLATFGAMFQRVKHSEKQREDDKRENHEVVKMIAENLKEIEKQQHENMLYIVKEIVALKERVGWMTPQKPPTGGSTPPPWTKQK